MKYIKLVAFNNFKIAPKVLDKVENEQLSSDEKHTSELLDKLKENKSDVLFVILPEKQETLFFVTFNFKSRILASVFYDPILMFLNQALLYQENSIKMLNEAKVVARSGEVEIVDSYNFSHFLQLRLSAIIVLHTAFDSFSNSVIPETDLDYKGKTKKEDIERSLNFKEKLKFLSDLNTINFDINKKEDKDLYDKLLELNKVRNDLVHFKTYKTDNNLEIFLDKIPGALRIDLDDLFETVIHVMNAIRPDYVTVEENESA